MSWSIFKYWCFYDFPINHQIDSSEVTQSEQYTKFPRTSVDTSKSDIPIVKSFESSNWNYDVTPQDLSRHLGISLSASSKTINKAKKRFLCSTILPLAIIYIMDQLFTRKTLQGDYYTDKMRVSCKFLEGNIYSQLFVNKVYFSRI